MPARLKRRSNEDIINFIDALPGGNVPQYAKLLNTTPIRINALLQDKKVNRRLVKRGRVRASEKGRVPTWAGNYDIERGCLRAVDVDNMMANGTLPKFVADLLSKVHEEFRDDTLNFFRAALEQTANKKSFEEQMRGYVEQTAHYTNELTDVSHRLAAKSNELDRIEALLDRSMSAAGVAVRRLAYNSDLDAEEAEALQIGDGVADDLREAAVAE